MARKRSSHPVGSSSNSPSTHQQPAPLDPKPPPPPSPSNAGSSTAPQPPPPSHASPHADPFTENLPSQRTWSSKEITTFLRVLGKHKQDFADTPEFWGRIKQDLPDKSFNEMREMYFQFLLPVRGGPQPMDVNPPESSERRRRQIPPPSSPQYLPPSTSKQEQRRPMAARNRDGPKLKATQALADGTKIEHTFENAEKLLEFAKDMRIANLIKKALKKDAAGKKPLENTTPSPAKTAVSADHAAAVAGPSGFKTRRPKSRVLEPATPAAARTSDAHDIDPADNITGSGDGGGFALLPEMHELRSKCSGRAAMPQFLKDHLPVVSGRGRSSSFGSSLFPALRDEHQQRSNFSGVNGVESSSKAAKPPSPAKGCGHGRTGSYGTPLPLELQKYCWSVVISQDSNRQECSSSCDSSKAPEEDRRKSSLDVETSTSGSSMPPEERHASGRGGRSRRSRR